MSSIVRAGNRFLTEAEGRSTRHLFSFGAHYDPSRLGFAAMVAHNDETLPPGTGYPEHPHSELEIVTWVLTGALRHTDSGGRSGVLLPGDVQRISTGTGIVHAEITEPGVETRFLQTWLRPDEAGRVPSYGLDRGAPDADLSEVVSPGDLGTARARLLLGTPTRSAELPDAPALHLFVVDGRFRLAGADLAAGDSALLNGTDPRTLEVLEPGPVAVWAFGV
ncbi:pirin family protein [Nocardioides marmorisolisilvae]|uniref:Pirin family protein n=1 Tax=Nocardioides marmorisolisilvae TaxID=1542737 RepID=A0A3N0DJ71_9ACTN|nr:pirin family protein [Nocardioides marmorisolisilvae]RNL75451.1 pirin family protein [Nocardioides marmorisolisilvae]